MEILRTPDERFVDLPGYPFEPHYFVTDELRIHFVDEGPRNADPILLLHGEPSWSYLYRKMIPTLASAGHRVIAPDLVGFGRSDKPVHRLDYTYQRHVDWMTAFVLGLDIRNCTLFCQDWGGLIGLRMVAEHSDRFARVVASNTFLPTGDRSPGDAFFAWQRYSQSVEMFPVAKVIESACARPLDPLAGAAYDAPFPDERYKAGVRQFPMLVPARPDLPASHPNRQAWVQLERFARPFLTVFGDSDPITRGADRALQRRIAGAKGQPHKTLENAGHFIQEDCGEDLAEIVCEFIVQ